MPRISIYFSPATKYINVLVENDVAVRGLGGQGVIREVRGESLKDVITNLAPDDRKSVVDLCQGMLDAAKMCKK